MSGRAAVPWSMLCAALSWADGPGVGEERERKALWVLGCRLAENPSRERLVGGYQQVARIWGLVVLLG